VRIVFKSLIQGVPSSPSRGAWVENAAPKPTPNQPQVLHIAIAPLIGGSPPRFPSPLPGAVVGGREGEFTGEWLRKQRCLDVFEHVSYIPRLPRGAWRSEEALGGVRKRQEALAILRASLPPGGGSRKQPRNLPQIGPQVLHSGETVDSGAAGYPFPRRVARQSSPETIPKSSPRFAYSGQIVDSGVAGCPFPRGLSRESNAETYPNSTPSDAFSNKIVDSGVPGIHSSSGWLQQAAPKPTPNRHQVLHIAVKRWGPGIPSPGFGSRRQSRDLPQLDTK
jgi:hypothetical protein